jgi:uracil-DNA glycosylase
VLAELPALEIALLVGSYAQAWHLGDKRGTTVSETVADWRRIVKESEGPRLWPLPHPSWRNNAWLKQNPWFDAELIPQLREEIRGTLARG